MKISKFALLAVLLASILNINSQDVRILLEKKQKVESTFSGDINQESTVHLVFYKDKKLKNYRVIPIFYDKNNNAIRLDELHFSKKPEIVSYHQNKENTLTLLFNVEYKKTLVIADFDLNTKKSKIKYERLFEKSNLVFKLPTKTILIELKGKNKDSINVMLIENTQTISTITIKPIPEQKSDFKEIFDSEISVINTDEYVEYGSFLPSKAYYVDGILKFVHDEKKTGKTTFLNIDLNNPESLEFSRLSAANNQKIKDINSYLFDNKIFYLVNANSNVYLRIFDVETKKILYKTNLANNLIKYFNPKEINKYINKTSKSFYTPTITVNTSVENNMVLNIGYVDNRTYNYYNDWWFQHWMWQQQIMQPMPTPNLPNFGPNPMKYDYNYIPLKDLKPFQIVLNSNFEILNNATTETKRKNIDKDKYKKRLDNNYSLYHSSLAFTANSVRSIYYVPNRKEIVINRSFYN